MSVYCTVEEAWGENFQGKEFLNKRNNKEGFADIEDLSKKQKIFTKESQKIYRPDDDYFHSSDKFRHFKLRRPTNQDYQEFNPSKIPKSYDRAEYSGYGTGGDFYDLDVDCSDPRNRMNNVDIVEEPQLLPNPYPKKYIIQRDNCYKGEKREKLEKRENNYYRDSDLCDNVTLHIMHCKECQNSVLRIIEKAKELENKDKVIENYSNIEENDNEESSDLDITEVILFILCGVFFIFLVDSIIAIGKRFR